MHPHPDFSPHPWFLMRGDTENPTPSEFMYLGAFESYGFVDGSKFKFGSASGKIPVTGNNLYPNLPNDRLTISDAESYANNIAPGFGIESFWGYCATLLLMFIEFGTFDLRSKLGKGITRLTGTQEAGNEQDLNAVNTKYFGRNTGVDSINQRLNEFGTGVGSGTDGETPICWRGLENPYGNLWKYVIGANFLPNGNYRVIKRDGTRTLKGWLGTGDYESGTGLPQTEGFISSIKTDELGGLAFMPDTVAGTSSTFLCDRWSVPRGNAIIAAGGLFYSTTATNLGPGLHSVAAWDVSSMRPCGARLEFRKNSGVV